MGAPRQIRVPIQLPLFTDAGVAAPRGASPSGPTEVSASPRVRWLVGHAAALCVGNHPIEQLLRQAGYDWLIDLTGWMERRIVQAHDDDTVWPEFPRELFRCRARGAPPLSPIALFNLVIVGALLGASSLRELERMASLDLRGMWILGGWCPDHSTIGRFMAKLHGQMSEAMFEHLTIEALRAVDTRVCDVSLDGTVIAAATSRYRRLGAEAIARHLAQAEEHARVKPDDPKAIDAQAKAQACASALAVQQAARVAAGRDLSSIVIYPHEPEAMLHMTKDGSFHPSFIASAAATPERMIVALDVNASDENASVVPLLDQACAISAKVAAARTVDADPASSGATNAARDAARSTATCEGASTPAQPHTITVARADSLYLAKPVLDQEERLGIELRISLGSLADSVVAPQGFNPADPKAFEKFRFRLVVLPATEYCSERVCLQCPMGALLHEEGKYPSQRGAPASVRYGSVGVRCGVCPYKARCILKSKRRTVRRYEGDEARERMRDRMTALPRRGERGARAKAIEPCFASLKGPQRLRRFRRRGPRGATLEFRLHALAHTMGRLVFLARRRARLHDRFRGARSPAFAPLRRRTRSRHVSAPPLARSSRPI